jgi:hypothetical protein
VVLVSDRFAGERFLNRHRMIYSTLTEELSTTVHALALHTYTIKECKRRSRLPHAARGVQVVILFLFKAKSYRFYF